MGLIHPRSVLAVSPLAATAVAGGEGRSRCVLVDVGTPLVDSLRRAEP
jgi:hypothetical protein